MRPHRLKVRGDLVDERLLGHAGCRGRLRDLLPMFVHADHEVHVAAELALETRDGVGADFLERVTDMRVTVRVVDGGGDIEARHA